MKKTRGIRGQRIIIYKTAMPLKYPEKEGGHTLYPTVGKIPTKV